MRFAGIRKALLHLCTINFVQGKKTVQSQNGRKEGREGGREGRKDLKREFQTQKSS